VGDITTNPRSRWFRDGDENDRICPRSWSALNHSDSPRTVDFVRDGIADFAFSVWTALYILGVLSWYYLYLANEGRHVRISDNDIFSGINIKIIYTKTFLWIYVVCDSTDNKFKNLLKLYYCRKPSVYKLIRLLLPAMIKNYAI